MESSYNENQTIMPTEDEIYNLSFVEALKQICSTCITPIMKRRDPALYNAAVVVQNKMADFEKMSELIKLIE